MSHAANILSHRAYRRRHLIGLMVLVALIVWGAVWGFTAYRFNQIMDSFIETAKANGTEIQFSQRSYDGTPINVHVHLEKMVATTKNGSSLRAGEAVFYLNLWNWKNVSVKLRDGIEGDIMGTPFTAGALKFGYEVPVLPPLDSTDVGLTLWVQPQGLHLKNAQDFAFGSTIQEGTVRLRVMGPVPNFTSKDSIAAWNDNSGVLEFDGVDMHWGPVTFSGNGTMGFDPELQPEGAFSGKIEGLDAGIEALLAKGIIDKRQEALLRSSINVLSRPSSMTGGSSQIVPITLQGGALSIGPVKLMTLTPIVW